MVRARAAPLSSNGGVALRTERRRGDGRAGGGAARIAMVSRRASTAEAMLRQRPYPQRAADREARIEIEAAARSMGMRDRFGPPAHECRVPRRKDAAVCRQPRATCAGDCLTGCNTAARYAANDPICRTRPAHATRFTRSKCASSKGTTPRLQESTRTAAARASALDGADVRAPQVVILAGREGFESSSSALRAAGAWGIDPSRDGDSPGKQQTSTFGYGQRSGELSVGARVAPCGPGDHREIDVRRRERHADQER